jgi:magnesium transporter
VSSGPRTDGELSVPFLVDPEHEDLAGHIEKRRFFWLDLQGPTDEQLRKVAFQFGLHALTIDDARTFSQRPKLEEYGNYIFLVAYGVDPGTSSGGPLLRELHMIISGHFVVTIHRARYGRSRSCALVMTSIRCAANSSSSTRSSMR